MIVAAMHPDRIGRELARDIIAANERVNVEHVDLRESDTGGAALIVWEPLWDNDTVVAWAGFSLASMQRQLTETAAAVDSAVDLPDRCRRAHPLPSTRD
ncbi:MAG: hypothetical protein U0231_09920 [Nitrospiraceae bacterium]